MATRYYIDDTVAPVSPAYSAGWEATGDATRLLLARLAEWDVGAATIVATSTGSANADVLTHQMVSNPIAAQTISGTIKGIFRVREDAAAMDTRSQVRAYVVSNDGATVRGVLLELDAAALSNEFPTALETRFFPRTIATLSAVVALDGDRIVVELGGRVHAASSDIIRVNSATVGSTTDHAYTEALTAADRGWIEFSGTITAYTAAAATAATGTGAANNPSKTVAPTAGIATATGTAYDATVSYLTPPRTIVISGTDYTDKIRWDSFMFVECANRGEVGMGGMDVDDAANSLDIPAMKATTFLEPAAGSSNQYLFTGYTHDRTTERGPGKVAGQRQWGVEVLDLNTLADDYILTEAEGADRPAETDYARVVWLLTSRFSSVGGVTSGIVPNSNTANMDASDYRGRRARDVLNDCAEMAGKNWFIYYYTAGPYLFYDVTSGTNLTSTLRISDVLADVDSSTTFAASASKVHKSPDEIYSTVHLTWLEGTVTVTNATTATTYRTREVSVLDTSIDTSAKATAKANAFLTASASELIRVDSISIVVPASKVNDIRAGQRLEIKLARHGVTSFTYYRAIRRQVEPVNDVSYRITLTLADRIQPGAVSRGGDIGGIWEKKSNATDDGATVIVDRGGITVTDGAITVTNAGAVVIIDGTSDMFKIAAEGTQSVTAANASSNTATTTLTGLGVLAATPAHLLYHSNDGTSTSTQVLSYTHRNTDLNQYVAATSGGAVTKRVFGTTAIHNGWVLLDGSGYAAVKAFAANVTGSSIDMYQKYFVLQETVF